MKCNYCKSDLQEDAIYCGNCGAKVPEKGPNNIAENVNPSEIDSGNFGWAVLGFFFPIIGLVLFFCWKSTKPKDAKKAGIGALIGGILSIALPVLIFIIFMIGFANAVSPKTNCDSYCSNASYSDGVCTCPNGEKHYLNDNEDNDRNDNSFNYFEISSEMLEWNTATLVYPYVVTVISSSSCPHCQEYKPVIEALAQRNNFKLYWFDGDKLSEEDLNYLLTSYDLEEYEGYTPYTFITSYNKFISSETGYANEEQIINFLKTNNVIE